MNKNTPLQTVIVKYAKSSIYTKILNLLYSYLKPKLLTPELMGLWSLLNLIVSLTKQSGLGSLSTIRYLIPSLEHEGKIEEIKSIKGTIYTGTFFITLFIVFGLIAISLLSNYNIVMKIGLASIAGVVLLRWYYFYIIEVMKAHHKFSIVSRVNYLTSSIRVIIGVMFIYLFSIYGLFASSFLVILIAVIFIKKRYKTDLRNKFEWVVFKRVIKMGLPIMLFNSVLLLLTSVDRVLISSYLGLEELGYYSIAVVISELILNIPSASREVIEPTMSKTIGNYEIEESIRKYYLKPLYNIAYYCPFLFIGVFFIFPLAVQFLLPRYMSGVMSAQILAFGSIFLALAYTTRGLIIINRWQVKATFFCFVVFLINIALNIYFLEKGFGIEGIAVGTVISYAILFLILYVFLWVKYNKTSICFAKHLCYLLVPFIVCIMIVFLYYTITESYSYGIYIDASIGFLNSLFVFYTLIYIISKKNNLVFFIMPMKT